MAPKRKGARKKDEGDGEPIGGAEAMRLKAQLKDGQLDDDKLLELLKANVPCDGLYSKSCKVRRDRATDHGPCRATRRLSRPRRACARSG